jgi:hypothetical protein
MSIGDYFDSHNENPKSFIWAAKGERYLEKVKRALKSLNIVRSV